MSHSADNSFLACRLCGNGNENALLDLASDKLKFAADYRNMVHVMTSIQIDPEDRLFSLVCRGCIKRVLDSYEFREKARKRNTYLLQKRNGLCRSADAASTSSRSENADPTAHPACRCSPPLLRPREKSKPHRRARLIPAEEPSGSRRWERRSPSPPPSYTKLNSDSKESKLEDDIIDIGSSSDSTIPANLELSEPESKFTISEVQGKSEGPWNSTGSRNIKGQFTSLLGLVPTDCAPSAKTAKLELPTPMNRRYGAKHICRYCQRGLKSRYYLKIHERDHVTCKFCKAMLSNIVERKQHEIKCVEITENVWVRIQRMEMAPDNRIQLPTRFLSDQSEVNKLQELRQHMASAKQEPIDQEIPNLDCWELPLPEDVEGYLYHGEINEQLPAAITTPVSAELKSAVELDAISIGHTQDEELFIHSLLTRLRIEKTVVGTQWNMGDASEIWSDEKNYYIDKMMKMLEIIDRVPVTFRRPLKNISVAYVKHTAPKAQTHFDSFAHLDPVSLIPRRRRPQPHNTEHGDLVGRRKTTDSNQTPEAMLVIVHSTSDNAHENKRLRNRKWDAYRRKPLEGHRKIAPATLAMTSSTTIPPANTDATDNTCDNSDVEIVEVTTAQRMLYDVIVCEDLCSDDDLVIDISADSDSERVNTKRQPDTPSTSTQDLLQILNTKNMNADNLQVPGNSQTEETQRNKDGRNRAVEK